jgi:hypothetical protein
MKASIRFSGIAIDDAVSDSLMSLLSLFLMQALPSLFGLM